MGTAMGDAAAQKGANRWYPYLAGPAGLCATAGACRPPAQAGRIRDDSNEPGMGAG